MTITRGTVLAGLLAVAGSTASLSAQQIYQIEARLVVDGSADAPVHAGIDTFLPGPQATRVGITVQARIRQTAASTVAGGGNYGIGVLTNSGSGTLVARFTHDDTTFSGGTYQPFARGRVSNDLGGDGLPLSGAFGGSENARSFRGLNGAAVITGTVADVNSLQGNALGATGAEAASANGFFPAAGASMQYLAASVNGLVQNSNPATGGAGTTPFAIGTDSPWYNLYRIYFDPKPNTSDPVREVTVSLQARIQGLVRWTGSAYSTGSATNGGLREFTGANALRVTFQVPTPGAAALLGLGGLLAARRRRA